MNTLKNVLTGVLVLCAVFVTVITIRREVSRSAPPAVTSHREPVRVDEWRKIAAEGAKFGAQSGTITITQFSDFQCPYCKRFQQTVTEIARKYPSEVSFVFRHFPIDRIHEHARAAAYAAECAASSGRFREFHDLLFQHQDSIGIITWQDFAKRAGMNEIDVSGISNCMKSSYITARISSDSVAAASLQLKGTPTVLINEWRFPGTPSFSKVDSVIQAMLFSK